MAHSNSLPAGKGSGREGHGMYSSISSVSHVQQLAGTRGTAARN